MNVASVGAVVRTYRKASGLSQKDLAALVGMSRATLNYLESGRDIEIGATKLLAVLNVLGVPLGLPEGIDRKADEATVDRAIKAVADKGKKLSRKVLVEALATGKAPDAVKRPLKAFWDDAPESAVLAAVRLTATTSGQSTSAIRDHAAAVAKAVGSSREAWLRGG